MKHIILIRTKEFPDKQTLGQILVFDGENKLYECACLELPWRNNKRNVSCVPEGTYDIVFEWSPRFKMNLWELKGVPNRSECKIHSSNYVSQLNGCIAPGTDHIDINDDGLPDVINSRSALRGIHKAMGRSKTAKITVIKI